MERVPYDELSMFHENAAEFGLPYDGPPTVRRVAVDLGDGRRLSVLVWGEADPELVFLHGGAQNAHTWDTVALALHRPLIAIDLPGHGHSDGGRRGSLDARDNAEDVAAVVRQLAPDALAVVGMSLGGITTIALTAVAPDLVRAAVLVDITPGVTAEKSEAITAFVQGPGSFPSFDAILARTVEHNPTRSVSSLRRGILHNAEQREDGSWVWRYARHRGLEQPGRTGPPDYSALWDVVSGIRVPLLLVRGMQPQSVVDDEDEAELLRRCPQASVVRIQEAGHSVQGDTPVELARVIAEFVGPRRSA
jgi:pimeloyl-ACP methyl ester carboxylesterase